MARSVRKLAQPCKRVAGKSACSRVARADCLHALTSSLYLYHVALVKKPSSMGCWQAACGAQQCSCRQRDVTSLLPQAQRQLQHAQQLAACSAAPSCELLYASGHNALARRNKVQLIVTPRPMLLRAAHLSCVERQTAVGPAHVTLHACAALAPLGVARLLLSCHAGPLRWHTDVQWCWSRHDSWSCCRSVCSSCASYRWQQLRQRH
jgi:hypothetical protein